MQPKKERTKKSVLTEKQEAYVEGVLDGKPKSHAAADAGYAGSDTASAMIERSAAVQNALAERREELSSATQITRAGVLNGILDAIEMARLQGEPLAMLAGYRDISKMMGYNAPEVKKVEVSTTAGAVQRKIQTLSDVDLLRLASGESLDVIEGDFRVID